jgi:hypothetical protein
VTPGDAVASPAPHRPADALHNPSYPQRIHLSERAHWQGILKSWEDRIAAVRQKLGVLTSSTQRPAYERLYFQMLGARDQVADAVRRLPMETGALYEEDRHRVHEAVAALERIARQWEATSA